jgi:hypothetical protein
VLRAEGIKSIIMKPYFCRYLPVEGEPQKGDKVIYPAGSDWTTDYDQAVKDATRACTPIKVKMFLCTRDIKPGDKIRGEYPSTISFDVECLRDDKDSAVPHWAVRRQDGNEYYYAKQDSFKVIGEVSPEAIWVKEWDEFIEENISRCFAGQELITGIVKLKGPCGHFH